MSKQEPTRIRKFLEDIVKEDNLSLLVNGPDEILKEILEKSGYKITYKEIEGLLEEVLEETKDPEVEELLEILPEKREFIENYKQEGESRGDLYKNKRKMIKKKRSEIPDAELTTNEELLGKSIMVESFSLPIPPSYVLCHVEGKKEEKLKFKPSYQQKEQMLSWRLSSFSPQYALTKWAKWPLETRIIRKSGFYVFERKHKGLRSTSEEKFEKKE